MHTCVLFVDDEPLILGLYEALSCDLGPNFTVQTAKDGRAALDSLEKTRAQIVVSDLEMPQMTGGELLTHVERKYPEAMRVVISGYDDELHVARCLTFGHRYLKKPVEPESLANTLQRLAALQQSLADEPLKELLARPDALPSPPETYLRLSESLQSEGSGSADFAEIISDDPLLSDKLLSIANSPEFGLSVEIETLGELFDVLGVHVIRALILGLHAKDFYSARTAQLQQIDDLWKHSLQAASFARKLASADRQKFRDCQTAYVAGLLHDIGRFILSAHGKCDETAVAKHHAAIGAYLLGVWGLPEPIVSTAELHHSLHLVTSHSFYPILYVHAGENLGFPDRSEQLDLEFLARTGKADRVPAWKEVLQKLN